MRFGRHLVCGVSLALLAVACGGETSVLLTVDGDFPAATVLNARMIGATGPLPGVHRLSDNAQPLNLPGTVLIRTAPGRTGIVLWAENAAGEIIAQARSGNCFAVNGGTQSKYQITLSAASFGWTPNIAEGCFCDANNPTADMCPPGGLPPNLGAGGSGGSASPGTGGSSMETGGTMATGGAVNTGGAGGTVVMGGAGGVATGGAGGTGGTSNAGGAGGTTMNGGSGGASMGGTGGVAQTGGTGGSATPATNELFSFDTPGDWSSDTVDVTVDANNKSQGDASIGFVAAGSTMIRSRAFDTNEVPGATGRISLDVYLEQAQGNEANIQMWFECTSANVYNAYVEYKPLGGVPAMAWTSVVFTLPAPVSTALQGSHSGCKLWMDHQAVGPARYDNLGFVP